MIRAAPLGWLTAGVMTACAAAPPGPPKAPVPATPEAKKTRVIALKNAAFENAPRKSERCPEGWECTMHSDPDSFVFRVEAVAGAQGKQALCVERVKDEPWALITQSMQATALRGAKLRFSVALRVDRAEGAGAGPWAVVHGPSGNLVHEERLLKATKGWERVAVEFPVGANAQLVEVGATLQGGGRICIDDARLEGDTP